MLSLLTGLVWEIFTIISNNLGKKKEPGISNNPEEKITEESVESDLDEEESLDHKLSLDSLIHPTDAGLAFLRQRLKDTKKDNLKVHEIILMRDDYSYAKKDESAESFKQIQGQE